jgi:hypothetical protein
VNTKLSSDVRAISRGFFETQKKTILNQIRLALRKQKMICRLKALQWMNKADDVSDLIYCPYLYSNKEQDELGLGELDEIEEIANMMEESQELVPAFVAFREARANADKASPHLRSAMVRIEKKAEHEFRKVLFAEQAFAMNMASMMEGHREQLDQILNDYF